MRRRRSATALSAALLAGLLAPVCFPARAETRTLNAMFTPQRIAVDGVAEAAWNQAPPSGIAICIGAAKAPVAGCKASATVQALWNGPELYLLFTVADPDIHTDSPMDTRRSGVQVYVDQYDDKFPKFEEDDGYIIVSAAGQQTGNRANADLPYYPPVWTAHLQSYAAAMRYDAGGARVGYTVEIWATTASLPSR